MTPSLVKKLNMPKNELEGQLSYTVQYYPACVSKLFAAL